MADSAEMTTFRLVEAANARMEAALAAAAKRPPVTLWLGVVLAVLLVAAGVLGMVYLRATMPERRALEAAVGTWDETMTVRSRDGKAATTDTTLLVHRDGTYELIMDGVCQQAGDWVFVSEDDEGRHYAMLTSLWEYVPFDIVMRDGETVGVCTVWSEPGSADCITKTFARISGSDPEPVLQRFISSERYGRP